MASLKGIKSFFEPTSIAVVGVSTDPSKLASIIYSNLLSNRKRGTLKATIYPLNPSHAFIGGQKCYPELDSLPEVPELVIVAVPASLAIDVVEDAATVGARAAVLITGGFAEAGKWGLEERVMKAARRGGMRLLGPNTIGLLDTRSGVDSLFLRPTKRLSTGKEIVSLLKPLKGGVVVITQSGHLGEIVSEELAAYGVGLRALVGTGNQLDVSVEDIVGYFAKDPYSKVIAMYLEGVKDGRRFINIASAAAKVKPVIVFKVGKTHAGALAALTHTASLVGDYEVYKAAFRKAGILEAESIQELVDYCVTLSLLHQRPGRNLLISTNAGGVGAVAADEAQRDGLDVKPLSKKTTTAVRACLGPTSLLSTITLGNPLDLTATVTTESFVRATETALASPDYDMAVVLPTHQTPAIDPNISERMAEALLRTKKPACVCVMGSAHLAKVINDDFLRRGIPSFPTPERSVRAITALASYTILRSNSRSSQPVDGRNRLGFLTDTKGPLPQQIVSMILTEYGIRQPKSALLGPDVDFTEVEDLKFPVACKLISPQLSHKTEKGGVILNVPDINELTPAIRRLRRLATQLRISFEGILVQEMVTKGIEIILGSTRDKVFGPTLVLGTGGRFAELTKDYALDIAPLDLDDSEALASRTRLGQLLSGYRGGPLIRTRVLTRIISRFSRILVENPSIEQIEINPLMVSEREIIGVDARAFASDF